MLQLSDEQVDIVCQRIADDGVTTAVLQTGLLDHYCCFIEEKMNGGSDFETAYGKAFAAITPNGMHEIEEELFFLMTFKKQINMKRIIYGTGFISAFLISMGIMFKYLHWPGASVMLFSGFSALIVTVSALLIHSMAYMKKYNTGYKVRIIAGFTAAMFISVGSMFKILHYPTANMQMVLGMTILNLVFLPLFFYQLYKQAIARV